MNDKTIRWITNLLLCIGTGFMVTGATTLVIGEAVDADTLRAGVTMCAVSFFVIAASYVVAMLEEEL
ncbi:MULTISPECIES: hypothetical protein [Pseudomonas]|uniref:Uncharacterized protein n=1 Tax=Pseudomonas putida TaxID=303 RepID=A0A1Y3LAL9_PSEPU|nr:MULTISPECIES: hypothetical protein [Pseudomonas]MBS6036525.1 hypothetical protein [Pseudomonas sp.]MCE0961788.1 hypothetical protein [Pseudomonas putida]MCE0991992.1 hypothetical protein [Pseudomonas alloputida]OUM34464.1 hypothetical protein B8W72_10685 [Pseudomonas putida]QDY39998.1 hypothetical protein CHR26_28580 [Pseudomonas putida]